MTDSPDPLPRLSALEGRVDHLEENVSTARIDAAAARHLAAAFDRDLADLKVKTDANRKAINALGMQTAERFDRLEGRFDRLEGRFTGIEGRFDRLEGRFTGIEGRLGRFEGRFTGIEGRLGRFEGEVRSGFATSAAGQQVIVDLITRLLPDE